MLRKIKLKNVNHIANQKNKNLKIIMMKDSLKISFFNDLNLGIKIKYFLKMFIYFEII